MTQSLLNATPESLHWVLSYIASPGVVIPLLVLLTLVIYYLVSLSSSLRETVTDLRTQLRQERDADRRKVRSKALADQNAAPGTTVAISPVTEKIIAQWRKAVPLHPKVQTLLAKEALEKRLTTSAGSQY